jgi:tyrosyl-tRNA synthetase
MHSTAAQGQPMTGTDYGESILCCFEEGNMDAQTFMDRGVAEAIVRDDLISLLEQSPRPLRAKFGVDPSSPDLTLGHFACFRKLHQLQELGHVVVVVIGDWTARIGDPTGRKNGRRMLDAEIVNRNAESYLDQFFRFVNPKQTEVRFQSEWFGEFGLQDVITLTSRFTVAQMMARDDFRNRFSEGRPISIAEFLYALLQAFDSVALEVDIELGGHDQLFNVLVGRTIMKEYGLPPQHIITVPILVGTDGVEKMGKSTGNYIPVTANPDEMFGAIMSLPDTAMHDYFLLLTDIPDQDLARYQFEMDAGRLNPRDVKLHLARQVVSALHNEQAAQQAELGFLRVFSQREMPDDMLTVSLDRPAAIVDLLAETGMVRSKSEARRLVAQGGVRLDGHQIDDIHAVVDLANRAAAGDAGKPETILRVGRRRFLRLVPECDSKEKHSADE